MHVQMGPVRRRSLGLWMGAVLVVLASSCTEAAGPHDGPGGRPSNPAAESSAPRQLVNASLAGVDTADLPALVTSSGGMPRTIPRRNAVLPSLLDDLPGRALLVINPAITTFDAPVRSWSELELLFFGVDGRWRRLGMEALGLSPSLIYSDTFGAGKLSTNGRWWAGPTRDGMVVLNLASGMTRIVPTEGSVGSAVWVPGRNSILTNGSEVTVPGGVVTHVPYSSISVGFEPDGTPLSLERGPDGQAVLVEWRGGSQQPRTVVPGISPPRRRIKHVPKHGLLAVDQLTGVNPTRGQFATLEFVGKDGLALVVADSISGDLLGQLTWTRRDFELFYDVWLDDETLLVATAPYFVAWRPATGELFRVTDARSLGDNYREVSVATAVGE